MTRPLVVIDVVGLTLDMLGPDTPHIRSVAESGFARPMGTVLPAVTCSAQSTLLTGTLPREHGVVAFATIGDPNVYSTFTYLAQTVAESVPDVVVETVPGITAMQDLAARSGAVLTEGTEPLTLVPVTAGAAVLKDALAGPGTVVAYKFGRQAGEVAEALRETGRIGDAVWGSALGLPESVAEVLMLLGLGYAVWLEWFVARHALGVDGAKAAMLVGADLVLGLFLGGLIRTLSEG